MAADWGLVTQAFIRLFDKNEHDIAKTHREIRLFKNVLQTLFGEGAVFSSRSQSVQGPLEKVPAIGGYFGALGVTPCFVTQHIEKMLRHRAVFNCGEEQVLLWGTPKPSDAEEIANAFVGSAIILPLYLFAALRIARGSRGWLALPFVTYLSGFIINLGSPAMFFQGLVLTLTVAAFFYYREEKP